MTHNKPTSRQTLMWLGRKAIQLWIPGKPPPALEKQIKQKNTQQAKKNKLEKIKGKAS